MSDPATSTPPAKRPGLVRRTYDWTMVQAGTPRGLTTMNAVSFAESSFFPIPPDPLLIALCYARPERWWRYALHCTLWSVLGGMLGYGLGVFAEPFVRQMLGWLGIANVDEAFRTMKSFTDRWGFLALSVKSLTPIPFKVFTIGAGVFRFDFGLFVLGATLGRAVRFFLVAGLIRAFGERIRPFIEKQLTLVIVGFFVVVAAGFVALKLLR